MNKKQLAKMGVPAAHLDTAVKCVVSAARAKFFRSRTAGPHLHAIMDDPAKFVEDEHFGPLAKELQDAQKPQERLPPPEPTSFPRWGKDLDPKSVEQMQRACDLPIAVAGALMPDAHLGYAMPIGGVLACRNAVIPYGVGVDIGCRMRATITNLPVKTLEKDQRRLWGAIEKGTRFGMGAEWKDRQQHPVMDEDWKVTPTTKAMRDRAWAQLGTSGTGNHFVEFGTFTLPKPDLGLEAGEYLCLLSHSGSRGPGAAVCKEYWGIAKSKLHPRYKSAEWFDQDFAWLLLDSEAGQEYWLAMELMGKYAAANHQLIHENVLEIAGAQALAVVENHHNFAWKEKHKGEEVIVHRKGATPAGKGVLGFIPGSMADPGYIVRGLGNEKSLHSASHGAGRRMSRTQARKEFSWDHWRGVLKQRGVVVMSAGIDEVPGSYKDIREVMAEQTDLVEVVGEFFPRLVKMAQDGKSED